MITAMSNAVIKGRIESHESHESSEWRNLFLSSEAEFAVDSQFTGLSVDTFQESIFCVASGIVFC
jgi:hypothetical protein